MSLRRLIYRSGIHELFQFDAEEAVDENRDTNWEISSYDKSSDIPLWLEKSLFENKALNVMKYRFRDGYARIFIVAKEEHILAYAWIQDWRYFVGRYGKIVREATMLGPDWTDPEFRGQGLHKQLIKARINYFDRSKALVAVVEEDNSSSARNFEKCGFVSKGKIKVTTLMSVFHLTKKV